MEDLVFNLDGTVIKTDFIPTELDIKSFDNSRKQKRITELLKWFEEYDNQVKQYQRCIRLGIEFDKDIVELDNQAKAYQEELRQLKVEVTNGN